MILLAKVRPPRCAEAACCAIFTPTISRCAVFLRLRELFLRGLFMRKLYGGMNLALKDSMRAVIKILIVFYFCACDDKAEGNVEIYLTWNIWDCHFLSNSISTLYILACEILLSYLKPSLQSIKQKNSPLVVVDRETGGNIRLPPLKFARPNNHHPRPKRNSADSELNLAENHDSPVFWRTQNIVVR